MPPKTLADLSASPERKILEGVATLLKADELLSDVFPIIRTLEVVTREAFANFGTYELAIQPGVTKPDPHPSKRETERQPVVISAFLPGEQTAEETKFVGLDLGNHIRKLLWGLAIPSSTDPTVFITFAVTDFRTLTPMLGVNGRTRILSYEATFETDIDPTTGDFR